MSKLCQGPWQVSRLLSNPSNWVHTRQRAINPAPTWDAKCALVDVMAEVVQSTLLLDRCKVISWGFQWCLIDERVVDNLDIWSVNSFDLWIISNLDVWAHTDKIDCRSRCNHRIGLMITGVGITVVVLVTFLGLAVFV